MLMMQRRLQLFRRPHYWSQWLMLMAALASPVMATAAAQNCQRVVSIGAWNIQWLGNAKEGRRQAQRAEDVASYIEASGVEVLALSEISATSKDASGKARSEVLDAALALLTNGRQRWKYELFEKRPGARAPDDQWIGVAWNASSIAHTGGPWRLPVRVDEAREDAIRAEFPKPTPDTIVLSRWPHAMKFSAGTGLTDWVVVPVHLKSNTDGPATAKARAYEVELLLEGLVALKDQHKDADLMVLGDSNMLATDEAAGALLAQAGYRDCNARDLGTHLPFRRGDKAAPFDRIFVVPAQPETRDTCLPGTNGTRPQDFKIVRPYEWRQGTTNVQFRKLLSDHLLVRAGICVQADDD